MSSFSVVFYDCSQRSVMRCVMMSHLMWAAWGLFQAKTSTIDFDYERYSKGRLEGYLRCKKLSADETDR
jgi:hypothetical protein